MAGFVIGTRSVGSDGRPAGFAHAVSVETRRTLCGVSVNMLTIFDGAPWAPTAGVEAYCPDCRRTVPLAVRPAAPDADRQRSPR
ncbi:MAG TPA: hypothetical protein VFZ83_01790 [Acidimicrobiia bacterium]|nr:hypothetical protein [Acidimicrobiia bacterium]